MDNLEIEQGNNYLRLFVDGTEAEAQGAFKELSTLALPLLHDYLWKRCSLNDSSLREDLVGEVYLRVWQKRSDIKNLGYLKWLALLKTIAFRIREDLRKKDLAPIPLPDDDMLADTEAVWILNLPSEFIRDLAALMNHHWLGADASFQDQTSQLLAAQLYYFQREALPYIQRIYNMNRPEERQLEAQALEAKLKLEGTILLLSFDTLHYTNHRLFCFWLDCEERLEYDDVSVLKRWVDALAEDEIPNGWTRDEVNILMEYYVLENKPSEIREKRGLSDEEIAQIIDSANKLEPYTRQIQKLLFTFEQKGIGSRQKVMTTLAARSLWQRLAFEYKYLDGLELKKIGERLERAAEQVQFRITEAQLNGWLSGKRLIQQLREECEERGLQP